MFRVMRSCPLLLLTLSCLFPFSALAETLIPIGATWRANPVPHTETEDSPAWRALDFDDSQWAARPSGFAGGFGSTREATSVIGLGINFSTLRFRNTFQVPDPETISQLFLRLDYQHGFAAYLNGHLVAHQNISPDANGNFPPQAMANFRLSGNAEIFDLSSALPFLVTGDNVLAIQVHGGTPSGTSIGFAPELLTNFTRGPILQRLSQNSATIVWQTLEPTEGRVHYREEPDGPEQMAESPRADTEHAVPLTGLLPGREYSYRILSKGIPNPAQSQRYRFHTPTTQGPVRFAVLGDSGQGSLAQFQLARQIRERDPHLILHAGDVVYPDFTAGRADLRCFSVYGPHMASRPYYFAAGNHDVNLGLTPFLEAFHQPTNDTPLATHAAQRTAPEVYFSTDYGDAHFAVLYVPFFTQYVPRKDDAQFQWLEADLAQSDKPWKFIVLHHNVFSSSLHTRDDWDRNGEIDQEQIQEILLPLASRYGVQVIFTGHDHVFERFAPNQGAQFVTSAGGGGGLYRLIERLPGSSQFWARHHFVHATLDGSNLTLEAIDPQGNVFDQVWIRQPSASPPDLAAPWHRPRIEPSPPATQVNLPGQYFDFLGTGHVAVTGRNANLGRLHVNHDHDHIYLGLEQTMIRPNQVIYLFLGTPHTDDTSVSIPPFPARPLALSKLPSMEWVGFNPRAVAVLGDERADRGDAAFPRPSEVLPLGQGVWTVTPNGWESLSEAALQQYDHSPQTDRPPQEIDANFVEIAIPKTALQAGEEPSLEQVSVAVVVGSADPATPNATIQLDTGYHAAAFQRIDTGHRVTPLAFHLADNPDRDRDGLTNEEELRLGTHPDRPDSDSDQLPDGWEVTHELNPLNASGIHGTMGDPDQDRISNHDEYQANTDPRDAQSQLRLHIAPFGVSVIRVSWDQQPEVHYTLEASSEATGPYRTIQTWLPRQAAGGPLEGTHFDLTHAVQAQFYRLTATRAQP